jgi:hypothetical protein
MIPLGLWMALERARMSPLPSSMAVILRFCGGVAMPLDANSETSAEPVMARPRERGAMTAMAWL